ncbi:unnamed protein product [Calicophoron daubneyi]|uniref:EF-hand domain-containing protein n=1 Tax=Calicophoron daubneyi TaxID=300641 RepID=A0AAV2T2V7_CALDB
MDDFVNIFKAVDRDGNGRVTMDELQFYVKENHLDEGMITRWRTLFDPEHKGYITLEKFCDVLGLDPLTVKSEVLDPEVTIIKAHLNAGHQKEIIEETKKIFQKTSPVDPQKLSSELKEFLDGKYGKMWQVVILRGAYWMTYTYLPDQSLQFVYKNYIFLVWKPSNT